jgi:uncharacterized membrane protein YfcA
MLRTMELHAALSIVATVTSGIAVGLALGLTGGGGSIFAVPLLIYVVGLTPARAMPISLVAVAISAGVGGVQSVRARLPVWQPTVLFALGGVLGAPLGILVGKHIDGPLLVGGFALLALTVGSLMWRSALRSPRDAGPAHARPNDPSTGWICTLLPNGQMRFSLSCAGALAAVGAGTGFLSGLFGIGGGFLIVPALVLITRMEVHRAIATSLLIIAAIGSSGAFSAVLHGQLEWSVLAPFAAGGAAGIVGGRLLAGRLAGPRLQQIFAVTIVCVGVGMLLDSLL